MGPFGLLGSKVGEEQRDAARDLVGHALERGVGRFIGVAAGRRVGDAPVRSDGATRELGADLADLVAECDDPVEALVGEARERFGRSAGDVDAALGRDANGVRVQRLRAAAGAAHWSIADPASGGDFYTRHFGFTVGISSPAFADATRGNLRLLLSGPMSSAGKAMTDGERPGPGGWNRIHLIVDDIDSEVARLTEEGVQFRNEIVTGPGGAQVLAVDPSGNLVELFQPAAR